MFIFIDKYACECNRKIYIFLTGLNQKRFIFFLFKGFHKKVFFSNPDIYVGITMSQQSIFVVQHHLTFMGYNILAFFAKCILTLYYSSVTESGKNNVEICFPRNT